MNSTENYLIASIPAKMRLLEQLPPTGLRQTGLRFFFIIVLVIGIFFRFVNLDVKAYTGDETLTSLRIAGYTWKEVTDQVFDGRVITIEDLRKYQRPNSEKGLVDTVTSLADDVHMPLYFAMARLWVQGFGNTVAVTRSLSAVVSLLVFPCIYWLCLELFESSLTGWIAIALVAVSPFHVVYAQDARPYSLWTVTILLSSIALLRAMRIKTRRSWIVYAASVALALHTYWFSAFVAIGHGIYVAAIEGFRRTKTVTAYLLASIAGFIAFAPWPLFVNTRLSRLHSLMTWTYVDLPLFVGDDTLVKRWATNLSNIFVEFGLGYNNPITYIRDLLVVILVGYSVYFIVRKSPKQVWLFIVTLIVVTATCLTLPDLIIGGQRSASGRYLMASNLGIHLAVAYLFATKITDISVSALRQKLWQLLAIALISSGILSCAIFKLSHQQQTGEGIEYTQVASIINKAPSPLFVSDHRLTGVMPFIYQLDSKVRFQLFDRPKVAEVPDGFSDVFLYRSSKKLQKVVERQKNYRLKKTYEEFGLMHFLKKPA